jgi:hypothetical protein
MVLVWSSPPEPFLECEPRETLVEVDFALPFYPDEKLFP